MIPALAIVSMLPVADVLYDTGDPFGVDSYIGYSVFARQSVAVRFTPESDATLERVSFWFLNAGFIRPEIHVTIRPEDETFEQPSLEILESMTFSLSMLGWTPAQESVESNGLRLEGGQTYWVVCQSLAAGGVHGSWAYAPGEVAFVARASALQENWAPGLEVTAPCVRVEGTPRCDADWNWDGTVEIFDVIAFLADVDDEAPEADLNEDGMINIFDVLAYLESFVGGCR